MRATPPALLPFLRSQVQGDILALTYLKPESEFSVTEIAQHVDASTNAVQREVERLVVAGLLADRRMGTSRLVRAVQDTVIAGPLTELLAVTYGPLPVLTDALGGLPGLEQAFIYGSWAARYLGEAGPVPNDVDVLVVGDVDADRLDERAGLAERVLRREVNIRRVRSEAWESAGDAFIETVKQRPIVALHLRAEAAAS